MSNIFLRSRHKFRTKFLLIAFLLINIGFFAQTITISGTVTAKEDNSPLPGANVIAKELNIGAVSDFDGNYTITVPKGTKLEFSYAGLLSQNAKAETTVLNIALAPNPVSLDETVVIGYGVQKKKEVTGAVAQVKAEEIESIITGDISSALQGQVAGLSVTANSGEPGEGSGILIRGVSSLTGSNDPLFVVDGVPQPGDPRLNPNEIETIDVLKDAASAAIYGTRASSGVILITTKKGTVGKAKVSLNVSTGFQRITREASLLNTEEQIFFDLNQRGRRANISVANQNRFSLLNDTDLRDVVQNDNALLSRYNATIRGGTKDLRYSFTLGYFQEDGIIINSELKRYNLRSNTQIKKGKWDFNNSFGFTIDDRRRPNSQLVNLAQNFQPFRAADISTAQSAEESDDESFGALAGVIGAIGTTRDVDRFRFDASSNIGYKINKALTFKTLISAIVTNSSEKQSTPDFQVFRQGQPTRDAFDNFIFEQRIREVSLNWNASLNYKKTFGKHELTGLALISLEDDEQISIGAIQRGQLFPDQRQNLALGSVGADATSFGALQNGAPFIAPDFKVRRFGTIGRLQYNYNQKYLISLSTRVDASTQFSPNNQYAVFPSASIGWNVSEENFWKSIKPVVNSFKLRASLGTTGNDRFTAHAFQNVVRAGLDNAIGATEQLNTGFAQTTFANPDVKWEVNREINLGADINLFKNKIQLTADLYRSDKEDLLLNLPNATSSGAFGSQTRNFERNSIVNIGDLTNEGLEFSARFRPNIGKVFFNIALTYAKNTNVVESLGNGSNVNLLQQFILFGDPSSRAPALLVGREAGSFLVFKTDGLVTEDNIAEYRNLDSRAQIGDLRYVDVDGDGRLRNLGDRIYGGSGLPEFEASLNFNVSYKNFSLSTNWVASYGHEVLNAGRASSLSNGRNRDLLFQVLDDGSNNPANPLSPIPTFRGDGRPNSGSSNFRGDIDRSIEDGSFLRLRNVNINYSIPKDAIKGLGLSKLNIFASGQNILTITDYTGFNPETGGNSLITRGLDRSNFPITARYSLGFNLEF